MDAAEDVQRMHGAGTHSPDTPQASRSRRKMPPAISGQHSPCKTQLSSGVEVGSRRAKAIFLHRGEVQVTLPRRRLQELPRDRHTFVQLRKYIINQEDPRLSMEMCLESRPGKQMDGLV